MAQITFESVLSEEFIAYDSFNLSPSTNVLSSLSDPARSTNDNVLSLFLLSF